MKRKESSNEKPLETEVLNLPPGVHVYWQQWKLLSVKDGVLVRKWESGDGRRIKWLIVLPEKMREQVMQEMCVSYQGRQDSVVKNVSVLRNKYYWVETADDVQTYGVPNAGGGTQLWVGYGCAARSFDHHPITKPEKTQICNL